MASYQELQERLKHSQDQSKELQESYDQLQNDYDKYVRKYKVVMYNYYVSYCVLCTGLEKRKRSWRGKCIRT